MRIALALCFFCLSSLVSAHPITYVFTGTLDRFEFSSNGYEDGSFTVYPPDPSIPLVVRGTTIFNGRTEVIGSITVDDKLGIVYGYTSPGVYFGQIVSWQMAFGGVAFSNSTSLSAALQYSFYQKGSATFVDELTLTSISSPDVVTMAFDFKGGAFSDFKSDELPIKNFNGGTFRMTGIGGPVNNGFYRGNLFGSITSLHRVDKK